MNQPAAGACPNCQQPVELGGADSAGWCMGCRRRLVRRANAAGHVAGALSLVGAMWLLVMVIQPGERFVLLWLLLAAAIYFVLFRVVRRMAFEIIRTRGVRPAAKD